MGAHIMGRNRSPFRPYTRTKSAPHIDYFIFQGGGGGGAPAILHPAGAYAHLRSLGSDRSLWGSGVHANVS